MEIMDAVKGISLARLRELAKAEREGRLVVLPCKVGDTVYAIRIHDCDQCKHYTTEEESYNCEAHCPKYIDEMFFELWMADDSQRIPAQIYFSEAEAARALSNSPSAEHGICTGCSKLHTEICGSCMRNGHGNDVDFYASAGKGE